MVKVLVLFVVFLFIFIFSNLNSIQHRVLKRKMYSNIKKIKDNGEFESIYNQIMSDINIEKVKKEHIKIFSKQVIGLVLTLQFIFVLFFVIMNINDFFITKYYKFIILGSFVLFFIGIFLFSSKNTSYKKIIIRDLLSTINSSTTYKNDININDESTILNDVYVSADFKDSLYNRSHLTDYIEYDLGYDYTVKLADINLQYHSSGRNSSTRDIYEGIVAKISRTTNLTSNILIERNKLFKDIDRIKDSNETFEKIFDIYSDDSYSVRTIISPAVKEKLIELYEKYNIMFEISIQKENMYIRFFSGPLFESPYFSFNFVNKKRLYYDYIIFKNILSIIEEINNLIPVS